VRTTAAAGRGGGGGHLAVPADDKRYRVFVHSVQRHRRFRLLNGARGVGVHLVPDGAVSTRMALANEVGWLV
jgi:hypothetical protein